MKILIVSNDFIEGEFLKEALICEGMEVCEVCSQEEVESYCTQHPINVILTLCHHNLLNGEWCQEFFDKIKSKSSPKIFLLSSILHEPTVISLYKGKVDQYFSLPVHFPRMIKNLANQISKS